MPLEQGKHVFYKFPDKILWNRGVVIGFPCDGLIEIQRQDLEKNNNGTFVVSVGAIEIKELI